MKSLLFNVSSALALSLIVACSTPIDPHNQAPVTEAGGASSDTADSRSVAGVDAEANLLNDPKGVLANRSVYFDFDQYDVKEAFNDMLSHHARYLSAHPGQKVLVQGNTDERGGREYNLALGQKRAAAVVQVLRTLGANEAQLEAVSLGKEKPKALGHDEAAWAENRRADIVY